MSASGQSAPSAPELAPLRPPLAFEPRRNEDREALARYATAIRAHIRVVVAAALVAGAAIGVSRLLTPRQYAAHAAFIATESGSSGTGAALGAIASQFGIPGLSSLTSLVGGGGASASPQFYGDLLTSSALVHEMVVTPFDASAVVDRGGKPYHGTLVDYYKPTAPTETDRVIEAMKIFTHRTLKVTVDRPTGIVHFEIRTKNRQLSALVARRLLDLVNDFNLRRRQSQAAAEREFDAKRAEAAADTLHAAEQAAALFRATNIDFSRSPALAAHDAELQRRVTFAQQIYTTIAQRYETASMEAVRNTPVVTVIDAPEGLVEARPRYTILIMLAAALVAGMLASLWALWVERATLPE